MSERTRLARVFTVIGAVVMTVVVVVVIGAVAYALWEYVGPGARQRCEQHVNAAAEAGYDPPPDACSP